MNELRRMAYLEAMGIDGYISRAQLPGAAVSRRLAIVPVNIPLQAPRQSSPTPVDSRTEAAPPKLRQALQRSPQTEVAQPQTRPEPAPAAQTQDAVARFSLVAIIVGGILWLEDLEGMPLAREQLQLVQGMARALDTASALERDPQEQAGRCRPEVVQFDWPIHTNQQLDLGEEAARASVAGFISRKLEQGRCRGLVLMGQACESRVALDQLDTARIVTTLGSARILQDARLKPQVWRDLGPLLGAA